MDSVLSPSHTKSHHIHRFRCNLLKDGFGTNSSFDWAISISWHASYLRLFSIAFACPVEVVTRDTHVPMA